MNDRLPFAMSWLLVLGLLIGCASSGETATQNSDWTAVSPVVFDERMGPLDEFLSLDDVQVIQFREVMSSHTTRTDIEYEIRVRIHGSSAVLRALVYDSPELARSDSRTYSRGNAGVVPGRGGAGITRRPLVFTRGNVVIVASGIRHTIVERRLRGVFGRGLPT